MQSSSRKWTLIGFSDILKEKYSTAQKMIERGTGPMTPTFFKFLGSLNHNKFFLCPYSFWDNNCQHFAQALFNLFTSFFFSSNLDISFHLQLVLVIRSWYKKFCYLIKVSLKINWHCFHTDQLSDSFKKKTSVLNPLSKESTITEMNSSAFSHLYIAEVNASIFI